MPDRHSLLKIWLCCYKLSKHAFNNLPSFSGVNKNVNKQTQKNPTVLLSIPRDDPFISVCCRDNQWWLALEATCISAKLCSEFALEQESTEVPSMPGMHVNFLTAIHLVMWLHLKSVSGSWAIFSCDWRGVESSFGYYINTLIFIIQKTTTSKWNWFKLTFNSLSIWDHCWNSFHINCASPTTGAL